jgi:hypothetical protein
MAAILLQPLGQRRPGFTIWLTFQGIIRLGC